MGVEVPVEPPRRREDPLSGRGHEEAGRRGGKAARGLARMLAYEAGSVALVVVAPATQGAIEEAFEVGPVA